MAYCLKGKSVRDKHPRMSTLPGAEEGVKITIVNSFMVVLSGSLCLCFTEEKKMGRGSWH